MAIESTYQSLLGGQRKRQKKQERNDMLIQAGTLATNLYQSKLDTQAEDFFNRSEVANQRIKYQEGYDLYNNKVKKLYEEGSASIGGLGTFIENGIAKQIAQERIYANMDEENVFDTDQLGSAINSYAKELTYGEKGIQAQLEGLYNSGKTLASMDKYDEYVNKKASLPENVGGSLMNKLVRGKSRTDIEADALNRVVNENNFVKDSEAFIALSKSFDAGLTIKDSEKLAQKVESYTKNIKMRPTEVLTDSKLENAKRSDGRGGFVEWKYRVDEFTNQRTNQKRYVYRANSADIQDVKIFKNEEFTIQRQGEEEEVVSNLTGRVIKNRPDVIYHISGEKIGQLDRVVSDTEESVYGGPKTDVEDYLVDAAKQNVNNILSLTNNVKLRDNFADYQVRYSGENEEAAKTFERDFNRNVHILGENIYNQLEGQLPRSATSRISAQIHLNSVQYNEDTDQLNGLYAGADVVASPETSGLRILEAIQDLNAVDPQFNIGISNEEFKKLLPSLINSDELIKFSGRLNEKNQSGRRFDKESTAYFLSKNMPLDYSEKNIFNMIDKKSGLRLYDYIENMSMGSMTRQGDQYYEQQKITDRDKEVKRISNTITPL